MTNIWKRSLSMFMAIVMVFSLLPMNVFAEGTDDTPTDPTSTETGDIAPQNDEGGDTSCAHENTTTTTVNATCGEAGSVTVTCECGHVVSTETIAATGEHTPGDAATCGEAQTCSVCGEVLNAALGHNFGEDNNAEKCSVCGTENSDYKAPEADPAADEGDGDNSDGAAAEDGANGDDMTDPDANVEGGSEDDDEPANIIRNEDELDAALAAGGEYTLADNITPTDAHRASADTILNLGEYTITSDEVWALCDDQGSLTINGGSINGFVLCSNGKLRLNGTTVTGNGYQILEVSGDMTISNATLKDTNDSVSSSASVTATLILNDCNVADVEFFMTDPAAEIVLNGTTLAENAVVLNANLVSNYELRYDEAANTYSVVAKTAEPVSVCFDNTGTGWESVDAYVKGNEGGLYRIDLKKQEGDLFYFGVDSHFPMSAANLKTIGFCEHAGGGYTNIADYENGKTYAATDFTITNDSITVYWNSKIAPFDEWGVTYSCDCGTHYGEWCNHKSVNDGIYEFELPACTDKVWFNGPTAYEVEDGKCYPAASEPEDPTEDEAPIVIPEDIENTIVETNVVTADAATNAVNEIKKNTALKAEGYNPIQGMTDVVDFEISLTNMELKAVGETTETVKIFFNVEPKDVNNQKVSNPTDKITFRLPVPDSWDWVKVTHDDDVTTSQAKGLDGSKYVEVTSANFSEFIAEQTTAPVYVAYIGDQGYETLADAIANAANDDEIVLDDAASVASTTIDAGKSITINLNGNDLTLTPEIQSATITVNGELTLTGEGNVIVAPLMFMGMGFSVPVGGKLTLDIDGEIALSRMSVGSTIGSIYGEIAINSGDFASGINTGPNATVTITDGIFGNMLLEEREDDTRTISVSGGTFPSEVPEEWLAEGCKLVENDDGTYSVVSAAPVAQIGDKTYTTLQAAIAAAQDGDTITLIDDITLGEKLTISGNVTISGEKTITRDAAYTGALFEVAAGATLTLDGGLTIDGANNYAFNSELYNTDLEAMGSIPKEDAEKYFTPEEDAPVATAYMIVLTKGTSAEAFGGTVNLKDVTIQNNYSINNGIVNAAQYTEVNLAGAKISHVAATQASGVVVRASGAGIKVNMNEGTVIDGNHVGGNHGIFMIYSGTVFTMNGGEVKNTTGWNSNGSVVGLYAGTFVMNGGTICSNSAVYGPANGRNAAIYLHANSVMEMNGGTICHNTGRSRGGIDSSKSTSKLTITGGEVLDNVSNAGNSTADIGGTVGTWEITGGTFTQDVSAWLAPNSGLVYDEATGTYGLTQDLYEYNGVAYKTLAEVIEAIKSGVATASTEAPTVKVLASHKIDKFITIDVSLNLDLNGKSITRVGGTALYVNGTDITVTIKGEGTVESTTAEALYVNAGTVKIENGTFKSDVEQGHAVYVINNGHAEIYGGTFSNANGEFVLNEYDKTRDVTTITVYGGTFYKFNPSNNAAEGAGTNFVAEGYMAEADGEYYTVRQNKDAQDPIITITFTDSNTGSETILKYPSERYDTIQKLIGTNDYADFVLGAEQSELLAYIADGRASNIVMTLHEDIELDAPINFYNKYFQVAAEYGLTIDGNGHTITWADGYTGTLINVESGISVTTKNLTIDGENAFTFYEDTTTVENGQNWYTRFVNVGEDDKAVNANVIVNAGNLTLGEGTKIQNVTIASTGNNGKTENVESGYILKYNDDLAIIKSNGGNVTMNSAVISGNAGMVLNAINATSNIDATISGNMGCGNKGGIIIISGGTANIAGEIIGNKAMARSATVLGVINGAEVTSTAKIDNNKHIGVGSNTAGAIVVLEGASQFVMNGGSISNNVGDRAGAIASRWVGGSYGQHEETSIVLNAGTIIGNTATNDSWSGASVFLRSPATIGEGMKIDGTIAVNAAPGELDIIGGTFTNFDLIVTDGLSAEITGGSFDADPSEWLAEGYAAPKNEQGLYAVEALIAEIIFSGLGGGETSITYPGYADSLQELVDYYMFCNYANETAIPGMSMGDYTPVLNIVGDLDAEDIAYLGSASTDGTYVSAQPMTWTVKLAKTDDAANIKAADGYKVVPNEDGTLTVREANYVAQIEGGAKYESLADAISKASAGDKIVLLADITENVTVNKDLTIDGKKSDTENYKYTGEIAVKGSTVDAIVKNIDFVNGTGYAITTNSIKSITVENCTVTGYSAGFLYANKSTPTVVVKDVEVTGGSYGFHWAYGTTATLENVTMTAVTRGLYIQNYAGKTINLKNCSINATNGIVIWERTGSSGIQTFNFEGNNTVSTLTDSQYAKYVLVAADATLTAPVSDKVTSGVEGYEVFYKDGKYYLAQPVAQIGETKYESLQAAIAAAQDGDTITLIDDIELTDEVVTFNNAAKITVELNGHKITGTVTEETTTLIYVTGCELTLQDSSEGKTGGIHAENTNGNLSNLIRVETDAKLVIESGNYSQDASVNGAGMIDSRGDEIITVKGGNFRLYNIGSASNGSPWIFNASSQNEKNIIVNGGTFNADIIHQHYPFEVMAPKERALTKGTDGIWSFVDAVAYVNEQEWSSRWYTNEVGYATLEEAIAAVEGIRTKDGKTSLEESVTLLADNAESVSIDKSIALNVNGFAYTGTITLTEVDVTLTAVEGLNVVTNLADHKVVYEDGTYKVIEKTYVAQIGTDGEKFESLQAAVDAARTGDEVIVLANLELGWDDTVKTADDKAVLIHVEGKNITLNLNGKTIKVEHKATEAADRIYAVILVADGAGLIVTGNGKIDVTAHETTPRVAYMFWKRGTTGTLVVENGSYHMNHTEDSVVYTNGDKIVTIKGGTWTLDKVGTSTNGSPWIFNAQGTGGKQIIIEGGTYNADINRQHWSDEAVVAKTHYVVDNGDRTWTVKDGAVAYVNTGMTTGPYFAPKDIGYATIEEAFAAAVEYKDEDITLLANVQLTKDIEISIPGIVLNAEEYSLDCNGKKIILTAADATLTAVEGLTVVTNMEGMKVVYEEGVYSVKEMAYGMVARIEQNYYVTLSAAIAEAKAGDTIVMVNNAEDDAYATVIPAGIKLDLNGKYVTARNVLSFGDVIDTAETAGGGIYISNDRTKAFVQLQSGNAYMPLYDVASGCYRFFDYTVHNSTYVLSKDKTAARYYFSLIFENKDAYKLLADIDSTGLKMTTRLEWTNMRNPDVFAPISKNTISTWANAICNGANPAQVGLYLTVSGLDALNAGEYMSVTPIVESVTGVSANYNTMTYNVQ